MNPYFSTFPAGAEVIVEKALKERWPAVLVRDKYSGLIIYEGDYSIHDIQQVRFFHNSFSLLYEIEGVPNLREVLNKLRTDTIFIGRLRKALSKKDKTFKIIASVENQNVAIPPIQLKKLESHITKEVDLSLVPKHPDVEIWILQRREGFVLVGLRITYPNLSILNPESGELSSQMANILCLVSEPSSKDIFLDPFAGYGGIISERVTAFPYGKIIAIEKDLHLVKKMKERSKNSQKNLMIEQGNAESLKLADASVDVIITDPPWGMYEKGVKGDIGDLYQKMLAEFRRVLAREGRLVVLTGAKDAFEEILKHIPDLKMITKTDVLVSGKKASIYQIIKS